MKVRKPLLFLTKHAFGIVFVRRLALLRSAVLAIVTAHFVIAFGAAQEPSRSSATIVEYRVTKGDELLVLPVNAFNETHSFVLDTGFSFSALDEGFIGQLGAPQGTGESSTAAGAVKSPLFKAPKLAIGPLSLSAKWTLVIPELERFSATKEERVRGILGMDALMDKVFTIDFDQGAIRFLTRATGDLGTAFPLKWHKGAPFALLEVEGLGQEEFLIDTGCLCTHSGMLRTEAFNKLLSAGKVKVFNNKSRAIGAFADVSGRLGQVGRLSLGRFAHNALVFDDASGCEYSVLGLGYLSRYIVTFDVPRSTMYLRPGEQFNRVDRFNLSGMTLVPLDGDFRVYEVDAGSAAEKAGLQEFDEIVAIDGVQIANLSRAELSRLFSIPGTRRIKFVQKFVQKEATIVLKHPLQDEAPKGGGN